METSTEARGMRFARVKDKKYIEEVWKAFETTEKKYNMIVELCPVNNDIFVGVSAYDEEQILEAKTAIKELESYVNKNKDIVDWKDDFSFMKKENNNEDKWN